MDQGVAGLAAGNSSYVEGERGGRPRRAGSTPASRSSSPARSESERPTSPRSLGHLAVRQGARVRFAKTSRILADLVDGHADRIWDKRVRELVRPDVLILGDVTMRQLGASQTDDLYELVSERQGR
ncbi:ATP-binding protein [Streptomyces sp. CB03238]|uniref:ATP-binding protein n=1 Tax=Streptomyces sp. CB03238 TaxID=1907777 RepID=UPI002408F24B|nr:ATP-binding protein [Streptomyces sp. CB03238]